jgi:hypothetical protein
MSKLKDYIVPLLCILSIVCLLNNTIGGKATVYSGHGGGNGIAPQDIARHVDLFNELNDDLQKDIAQFYKENNLFKHGKFKMNILHSKSYIGLLTFRANGDEEIHNLLTFLLSNLYWTKFEKIAPDDFKKAASYDRPIILNLSYTERWISFFFPLFSACTILIIWYKDKKKKKRLNH